LAKLPRQHKCLSSSSSSTYDLLRSILLNSTPGDSIPAPDPATATRRFHGDFGNAVCARFTPHDLLRSILLNSTSASVFDSAFAFIPIIYCYGSGSPLYLYALTPILVLAPACSNVLFWCTLNLETSIQNCSNGRERERSPHEASIRLNPRLHPMRLPPPRVALVLWTCCAVAIKPIYSSPCFRR
jgi:hypothetical protein